MKNYNRKYISYYIYTKAFYTRVAGPYDYYWSAKFCLKHPEKCIIDKGHIRLIKEGCCVIRKVTQEWNEE